LEDGDCQRHGGGHDVIAVVLTVVVVILLVIILTVVCEVVGGNGLSALGRAGTTTADKWRWVVAGQSSRLYGSIVSGVWGEDRGGSVGIAPRKS